MSQNAAASQVTPVTVACSSKIGETTHCAADTTRGVVLARSSGTSACLLGRTWGYDDRSVWVSDGCVADFLVAGTAAAGPPPETTKKAPRYVPNGGFLIVEDELGEVYVRLFSYARYLNQLGLDETYTDAFGNVRTVQRRQDAQLQKFFLPFSGLVPDAEVPGLPATCGRRTPRRAMRRRSWARETSAMCSTST